MKKSIIFGALALSAVVGIVSTPQIGKTIQGKLAVNSAFANEEAPVNFYKKSQLAQSFDSCKEIFPNGRPVNFGLFDSRFNLTALCSNQFAVLYSKTTKTPLLVVERMSRQSASEAGGEKRTDNFYADPRLKRSERAELDDYRHNWMKADRGHMFPAGDAVDQESMNQSFALSNMTPQSADLNRGAWAELERQIRKYAKRQSDTVYVYTGALFSGNIRTIGKGQVWIPSHYYKVVYEPAKKKAWAHLYENKDGVHLAPPISYETFKKETRLNLIPGL